MLKRQLLVLSGCVFCAAILSSCSGDKVLPSGKRISVLEQSAGLHADVADGAAQIKIPDAVSNSNWLQNDMNAMHLTKNIVAATDFQLQWTAKFGTGSSRRELLISKPLIKDKIVYTLDADGVLSALQLEDGEKIWTLELKSANRRVNATALKGSGIAIEGQRIYITTGFGVVVAVDLKTQKQLWEQNLRAPIRIAPVVANGHIFVQSVDNQFYALNAEDGEILWQYDIAMENTTIVGGAQAAYNAELDMVATGFSNGEIQTFNASLGTPLWADVLIANRRAYSSTFLHTLKASPVIDGNTLYALSNSGVLAAIDMNTGERLWDKDVSGTATPLLIGNTLYVVTGDGNLAAFDKENGNVLWSVKIEAEEMDKNTTVYAPIMLNNRLIVTLSDGHVIAYEPKTGKVEKTVDLDEDLNSSPIAANGYVLFVTTKAKLLAYK